MRIVATVCNFNGREYLDECLKCLGRQSVPLSRIVVYDNASEDDSVAFVRDNFPDVVVVEMGANEGPCPARNRALEEADTEWVLQIDSDVMLEPDCLEKLLEVVEGADDVAVAMPRAVFHHEPERIHYDGGGFHYIGLLTLRHFFQPVPKQSEPTMDIDGAIAMALLIRRRAVLDLGAYYAPFFILFEDHDLSYRLRSRGWRIRLRADAIVKHREGTKGISYREGNQYPERRAFLHSRNRWMLLIRNHSLAALLLGLPGILLYECVWILFALVKGNLGGYARGKWEFVRLLPRLCRERRVIQEARVVGDRILLGAAPLTHAPMVKSRRWATLVEKCLDGALRLWWRMVAWLVPAGNKPSA